MNRLDRRSLAFGLAITISALLAPIAPPAQAQQLAVPGEAALEILVKQTLLTFNDANLTGNYTVFHASLSDAFRRQFTVDQVRTAFREFHDQQIDLAGIIVNRFVLNRAAAVNASGVLEVDGRFDTRPLNINFVLQYFPATNGEWKLASINVNLAPPGQAATSPGQPGGPSRGAKGRM